MANHLYNWGEGLFYDGTGDGRSKRKKELDENPLGLKSDTSGIIRDTQETLRQNRETGDAIGEAARRMDRAVPLVKIPDDPVIKPQPQTAVSPARTDTDSQKPAGSRFGYGTKTVDTRQTESGKRDQDYENNLKTGGANEGFTIREDTSEVAADSKRRVEENAVFIDRFLRGNEKEKRFANGIPAPGEAHKSIFGMYMGAKNKSDNALQEDWAQSIKDWEKPEFSQELKDIYHSGMAGGYDVGNGIVRGVQMVEPFAKKHYQYPWKSNPRYTDPGSGIEYEFDPMEYGLYRFRQQFREESKNHENARSQDFNKASLKNPGYLGVKVAGKGAQDIMALLGTAWFIKNLGPAGLAGEVALGALNGKGKSYDEHMDEVMKKSEEELWKNGAYREMREAGRTDHQARFAIGTRHARMESDAAALFGAVKALLVAGAGRKVRDGTEGAFTKGVQDYAAGKVIDELLD